MVRRPLPWFAIFRLVNQQQLLRNEYLAPENRILRAQLPKRMLLTDPQRCALADTGRRLGRKVRRARRVRGETGHDSGVVPTTDRREV
jgi:hypothetical protein